MKNLFKILTTIILVTIGLMPNQLTAQAPEKMTYQAVIRSTNSDLVKNTNVGVQLSFLQGTASGTAIYVERHFPTTNANGLVTIEIGGGTVVSGDITTIDWANGPYFIKTETDLNGGSNYTITGTSQLLSVPYALHAKTAERVTDTFPEIDPVFGESVASGITEPDIFNWNNKLDFEIDSSVTNELQTLSFDSSYLSLSPGGGSVLLPIQPSSWWKKDHLNTSSISVNKAWVAIGPELTIVKQNDDTNIEIYVNTRVYAGVFSNTLGILLQARIDGIEGNFFGNGAITESNQTDFLSFMSIFESLLSGSHTVQVYTRTSGGQSDGVLLDPGGWGGTILVKETY